MIKNERHYRITKAQLIKFENALSLQDKEPEEDLHPMLIKAQRDSLQSQLDDLRAQVDEYEALRSGKRSVLELNSWEELPRALIQARIAARLSQKALAERLGLKEQQIQQYEASEYASADFERINQVIQALGVRIREDLFLPHAKVSFTTLFKRLRTVGLDRNFVIQRLLSPSVAAQLQQQDAKPDDLANLALASASAVGRIFNLTPASIFGKDSLHLNSAALADVRFKVPANANEERLDAYTLYAHYLALLALEVSRGIDPRPVETNAANVSRSLAGSGPLTLRVVLNYVWDLGIPVLPLNDPGAFHGACWRVEGRNVIVLKQRTQSQARWIIDALHELFHAGQNPELERLAIIDTEDPLHSRESSPEEQLAVSFSCDVALSGRAEDLAALCVEAAGGSIERLKAAVPRVARREHVSTDLLANFMAYRLSAQLSVQKQSWWPVAQTLQTTDEDPWIVARDIFLERADFSRINASDRELMLRALATPLTGGAA